MNFFYYREPGRADIVGYKSEEIILDRDCAGFRIVPFDRGRKSVVTIPAEEKAWIDELSILCDNTLTDKEAVNFFPLGSTSAGEHTDMVTSAIAEINGGHLYKCVISRAIVEEGRVDVYKTFTNLCESYPGAFVFCFFTEETGLWMGATPELLLKKAGNQLSTMALAGTMDSDIKEDWDIKNLEEHNVVTDYIAEIFRQFDINAEISATTTIEAGPVKHLQTSINGLLNASQGNRGQEIADQLSPTPALSGFPIYSSIELIERLEKHDRSYYGGYIGYREKSGDFSYYVNLRSMLIEDNQYCLYSGGGIMGDSKPIKEWEETERKSMTLRQKIAKNELLHNQINNKL